MRGQEHCALNEAQQAPANALVSELWEDNKVKDLRRGRDSKSEEPVVRLGDIRGCNVSIHAFVENSAVREFVRSLLSPELPIVLLNTDVQEPEQFVPLF
eukprot:XP_001707829.1 Hypothetical protein GL50803_11865 [Giardia lamblia ATCC 50803]